MQEHFLCFENKVNMYKNTMIVLMLVADIEAKYIEGTIDTNDNWAFLARFCFLSEEGLFEYYIEFNEDQGDPNLLLYYDTEDQWPAVYKSNKTCYEKEAVLHLEQNQVINLTASWYHTREISGCQYSPKIPAVAPTYTVNIPTLPPKKNATTKATTVPSKTTTVTTRATTVDPKATTVVPNGTTVVPTATTVVPKTTTVVPKTTTVIPKATTIAGVPTSKTTLITTTEHYSTRTNTVNAKEDQTVTIEPFALLEDLTGTTRDVNLDFENIFSDSRTVNPRGHTVSIIKRSLAVQPTMKNIRRGRTVVCFNARRFRSSRERWWFVAISNCNTTKGIHVNYRIRMTNGPSGDYWHEHYSADEFYILPILMAFSIAYSFLLLGIVVCSLELKSRQLLHATYKIFLFSVVCQFFGILLQCIFYLKYATNGMVSSKVRRSGAVLMGSSETLFLLLLLLLAKGYTVTRGRLPISASVKLTVFMCLYVVTYISIFIYEAEVFDPGEVLYLYESPAGYGLIVLRIGAWCMFIYSTIFTLKHYPEKSNFYYPFNICGTIWFVAGPAFILSANTYIDKWVRESVVCAVTLFISFGGHLSFLILTMPSVANKNFPYHVRTSQIGVMEMTDGSAGPNTIEQFGHHPYEPSTTVTEQTVIIPLTRRTEEIFEGMYSQRMHANNRRPQAEERSAHQNGDVAMENVMNWSLAKNISALELQHFDRMNKTDREDSSFVRSPAGSLPPNDTSRSDSRRSSTNNPNDTARGPFDDYIRDVPVELFTISKMVVTKNHS